VFAKAQWYLSEMVLTGRRSSRRGGAGRAPLARWWLALVASAALSVGVGAQPVSATPLWKIIFTGHGSSKSDATEDLSSGACPDSTVKTTIESTFIWIVTWKHVALSIPPVTGNISGTLYGTTHETNTKKAPSACGGNSNCDKSFDFSADEGLDGSNPAALLVIKSHSVAAADNVIVDLLTFSDQDAECESLDPDDTGFLVGDPTSFAPKATDALAATAILPVSELNHSGKIIISVHKTAFNYPTPGDDDCSDSSLGLTSCSHSQTWDGTITMTRTA
jgi:hypothetical protein